MIPTNSGILFAIVFPERKNKNLGCDTSKAFFSNLAFQLADASASLHKTKSLNWNIVEKFEHIVSIKKACDTR